MQIIANILLTFSLYAIIGMGFYLLFRTHKFLNLGHGSMITIGAYTVFALSHSIFTDSIAGLAISLILGGLIAGVCGVILDVCLYRLLREKKRSPLMMLVASLGVSIIIQSIIALIFSSQYHIIDTSENFSYLLHIFGAGVTLIQVVQFGVGVLLLAGVILVLRWTLFGRAVRAVSDDAEVSKIVGIPVGQVLIGVSFIAAGLAGLAGGFTGIDTGILPLMGFALFLKAVVCDIIGGLETYWGPILGALIVAVVENVVVIWLGAEWRDVATYTLLLVFLLFKPQGILRAK